MKEFWKIGTNKSTVISNVKTHPDDRSGHSDIEYYGGYLVCESIATKEHAELIASALEMKEMLNHFINAVQGGKEQAQGSVISGWNQTFGRAMIDEAKRIIGRND